MDNFFLTQLTVPDVRKLVRTELRTELEDFFKQQRASQPNSDTKPQDFWGDIDWLCEYRPDKPAKSTVYRETREDAIPHHKKGKRLYFLKSEIDAWLKSGKIKSDSDIAAERDSYLTSLKK